MKKRFEKIAINLTIAEAAFWLLVVSRRWLRLQGAPSISHGIDATLFTHIAVGDDI